MIEDYFEYAKIDGDVHFFLKQEIPFLGKFGSNNLNCSYKLKFGTEPNSNMGKSMVMLTFSVLDYK